MHDNLVFSVNRSALGEEETCLRMFRLLRHLCLLLLGTCPNRLFESFGSARRNNSRSVTDMESESTRRTLSTDNNSKETSATVYNGKSMWFSVPKNCTGTGGGSSSSSSSSRNKSNRKRRRVRGRESDHRTKATIKSSQGRSGFLKKEINNRRKYTIIHCFNVKKNIVPKCCASP